MSAMCQQSVLHSGKLRLNSQISDVARKAYHSLTNVLAYFVPVSTARKEKSFITLILSFGIFPYSFFNGR